MTLVEWVRITNITVLVFAKKIGVSRSQVHKYMYENAIPRYKIMLKIFLVTKQAVTPNDFYGIALEIISTNLQQEKIQFEDYTDAKD